MKESSLKFLRENNIELKEVSELKGGISNSNYLINFKYVLKEPFEEEFARIREDAVEFENRLAQHFISPKAIAFDCQKGLILSEYLEGFTPIDIKHINLKQIKNLIQIIKVIHKVKLDSLQKIDFHDLLDYYRLKLPSEDRIYFSEIEYSNAFNGDYEPSHFDLVSNNILTSEDYEIKIIDFEFSCLAPVDFDLVSLLGENNFDPQVKNIIIDLYFGKDIDKKEKFIAKYDELVAIADILWYHWAKARSLNCSKERKKIFEDIAREKRARLFNYISISNLKKIIEKDDAN